MASSLAELVRPTQTSRSAAQQSALASTVKPKTRFDDVLAQHRPADAQEPKAERPEPSSKTDRSKKADVAQAKKSDPSVDEARTPDDASQDAAPTEEAAADEVETSKPTGKPSKAKPSKDAQKPDDGDDANADEVSPEATAANGEQSTTPVAQLPVGQIVDEVDDIDADEKPVAKDDSANTSSAIDPNALIAQLNQAQPLPTDEQATPIDPAIEAGEIASVTKADGKAQAASAPAQANANPKGATDAETELTIKPHAEKGQSADKELPAQTDAFAGAIELPPDLAKADTKSSADGKLDPSAALQAIAAPHEKSPASHTSAMPAIAQGETPVSPRSVAEENVDRIVTSIHGDIATKGGTMQIRLDPPSLGAINVQISIDDGVMSASLQTNNDEATRLLSHNLAQLKSQLESAGVTVDRIQVKQATPTEQSSNSNSQGDSGDRGQNRDAGQDQSARQEQQRREMLQRMWAKLAGNGDPLDLVA